MDFGGCGIYRLHMRRIHAARARLAALILLLAAGTASANGSGISGQSGKQDMTCNSHHVGGVEPVVRLEGPSIVAAGAVATFRFTVESQAPLDQLFAGLDVAASDGVLGTTTPPRGAKLENGEITHTQPRRNDDSGAASWLFTWRAPAGGPQTLFAAGNSVDGFGNTDGDRAATTQLSVEVGCLGDCNRDGQVTIDELITAVALAQGGSGLAQCPLADGDGDGMVQVQELIGAVQHSMVNCE